MILMSRFNFSRTHCVFYGRLQAIGYLKTVQLPELLLSIQSYSLKHLAMHARRLRHSPFFDEVDAEDLRVRLDDGDLDDDDIRVRLEDEDLDPVDMRVPLDDDDMRVVDAEDLRLDDADFERLGAAAACFVLILNLGEVIKEGDFEDLADDDGDFERLGKTLCASGKTPYASGRTPCASGRTPCASGKTPCASGRTPCASAKRPSSSGKIPCASGMTSRKQRLSP